MGFEALTRGAPARSRSNWPTSEGEGVCERAAGRTEGGGREVVWRCGGVGVSGWGRNAIVVFRPCFVS